MPSKPFRILSTKVLSEGVAALAARDHVVLDMQDFIDITFLPAAAVHELMASIPEDAWVVFTSANASRSFASTGLQRPHWRVASLQGATKAALPEGMHLARTAPDAAALAALLVQEPGLQEVYFCCGDMRRDTIPQQLQQHNIHVFEKVVYHNTATPHRIRETYDAVLFFSPTAVKSFFAVNALPATTICFAIGSTTGAALQASTHNNIITADSPAAATLLQTAIDHLEHLYNSKA
ncbi:hypothetical protein DCC81_09315 [Chitinophaga parva]|uniref:Tetrapyrrole biosynthesis uroporphyrinogen III synthase domain-containing protein n=1 Tax=Chitinophaga parva TaxID=2169414 RepID=A0A2T7BPR9_9BACT|nr:uroporphyrinogen-III synthase [Chitinophaga parva]PUZ29621.1 hypothetical protein DCC81_09315 [Chitinophaga parva]